MNRKNEQLSLTQLTAVFGSGNLVATMLRLVGGVLTSRMVDPSVLGLYSGIGLVRGYAPFLQAGVANGLNRELPYHMGRGDREQVETLAATAQTWLLLVSAMAISGLLAVGAWQAFRGRFDLAMGWASFTVPVFGVLYGQFYLQTLYKTHGRFPRLSFVSIVTAAVGLVTVILVWWLGFGGLCLRGIIVAAVTLVLLWHWRPLVVRPRWHWPGFRLLLTTGIPIWLAAQLYSLWPVLNSTLVLSYMGSRGLGLFSIANLAGSSIAMFPLALSQVVYPKMAHEYGRTGRITPLLRMTVKPTLVTLGFTALVVMVVWFALPPVIRVVLPKYVEGTAAAQWQVASIVILALTPVNNIFVVTKKLVRYGAAIGSGMAAYYLSVLWLVRGGPNLEVFPQAMIIGRTVFVGMCLILAWNLSRNEGKCEVTKGES
jgi:O-antigen/teichoic acid export membrane protein